MNITDMWLVYQDDSTGLYFQNWKDLNDSGTLIDPETGDDLTLIGWTDSRPRQEWL